MPDGSSLVDDLMQRILLSGTELSESLAKRPVHYYPQDLSLAADGSAMMESTRALLDEYLENPTSHSTLNARKFPEPPGGTPPT